MLRHRGILGGGVLLGLLVLSAPGRTDEAAAVKAVEKWVHSQSVVMQLRAQLHGWIEVVALAE